VQHLQRPGVDAVMTGGSGPDLHGLPVIFWGSPFLPFSIPSPVPRIRADQHNATNGFCTHVQRVKRSACPWLLLYDNILTVFRSFCFGGSSSCEAVTRARNGKRGLAPSKSYLARAKPPCLLQTPSPLDRVSRAHITTRALPPVIVEEEITRDPAR
jgi:hypothetical protein